MAERRFVAFRRCSFLGVLARANEIASGVIDHLAADPSATATIDMTGVAGVSFGFADELLTHLDEAFGAEVAQRVRIVNAHPDVAEMLRVVSRMFALYAPVIEDAADAKGPPA